MRGPRLAIAALVILATSTVASIAQVSPVEIPAAGAAPKSLEVSGNIDANYSLSADRSDSPLLRIMASGASPSGYSASYPLDLYLFGDYQKEGLGAHFKTHTSLPNDSTVSFALDEAYGALQLNDSLLLQVGTKIYAWGKGYAFNPAGFVNPAKDPSNPDYLGQGILSGNIEFSKSLNSAVLSNFAMDLIAIPPALSPPASSGDVLDTDLAAKLYLLTFDADIDIMGYWSRVNPRRVGIDFSRNILPSLELHGEASYTFGQPTYFLSGGPPASASIDSLAYLAGLRWLNALNMTTILEFYHNDGGLSAEDYGRYLDYLQAAALGNVASISQARNLNKDYFSQPNLLRDYVYLKLSWPEPFGIVDFTPSVFSIYGVDDASAVVALVLSYNPFTNFEFDATPTMFIGPPRSQYGSKPYLATANFLVRFYF